MKVLLSRNANENIKEMTKALEEQSRVGVELALSQSFANYQPWMSNSEDVSRFSRIHFKHYPQPDIITDNRLILLAEVFRREGKDLNYIYPASTFLRIAEPTDKSLPRFKALFSEITQFFFLHSRSQFPKIEMLVHQIIPLTSSDPKKNATRPNGSGFSSHAYRGGVFLSRKRSISQFCASKTAALD